MKLDDHQRGMLAGDHGQSRAVAMEILVALGEVFGAERLLPVTSVQVSGVSFGNLGEHGLAYLEALAADGAQAVVSATLNPAGMDLDRPEALSPPPGFAEQQRRVVAAYQRFGIAPSCTCTPYLAGNLPAPGDSLAWSESSAVTYANSVIGARTNREGGPSALAAALTGVTPAYGLHLDEARRPRILVEVGATPADPRHWGLLGRLVGELSDGQVCLLSVPGPPPGVEALKALSAALPTYGGAPMFLLEGVSPEADRHPRPSRRIRISATELVRAAEEMVEAATTEPPGLISLGCPHATLAELRRIADRLTDRLVIRDLWISTSRPVKVLADSLGITARLEQSGALLLTDTCFVVAPIAGRFARSVTSSAKGVYYGSGHGGMDTGLLSLEACVDLACGEPPGAIRAAEISRLEQVLTAAPADSSAAPADSSAAVSAAHPPTSTEAAEEARKTEATEEARKTEATEEERKTEATKEARKTEATEEARKTEAAEKARKTEAAEEARKRRTFECRVIRAGEAEGEALVSNEPVSFYGGVDLDSGVVVEPGHPLQGQAMAGRVLVMPRGKGSTVGSWVLLRLARQGVGPAAVVCAECETIVAVGAILAEIPCLDGVDVAAFETGERLRISGATITRDGGAPPLSPGAP